MGRMKEFPRYNVISVRVTDEEMTILKYLSDKHRTTYSQLLRKALAAINLPSYVVAEDERCN